MPRTRARKRQMTLNFAPSSSSPATKLRKQKSGKPATPPSIVKNELPSSPPVLATPIHNRNFAVVIVSPSKSQTPTKKTVEPLPTVEENNAEDDEDDKPVTASARKKKRLSLAMDEEDEDVTPAESSVRKQRKKSEPVIVSSEDEAPVASSARKRSTRSEAMVINSSEDSDLPPVGVVAKKGKEKAKGKGKGKAKEVLAEVESESDVPLRAKIPRERMAGKERKSQKSRQRRAKPTSSESTSDAAARRKRKGKQVAVSSEDEDDEDDIPKTPARKRKRKSTAPAALSDSDLEIIGNGREASSGDNVQRKSRNRESDEDEEEELQEDLELAKKTRTLETRTRNAGSARKHKSPFQKHLAALKAKRAGQTIIDSDSDDEPRQALYDSDDGAPQLETEDDSEETTESIEEDYIVPDDENNPLGGPDDVAVPIEFTSASHMSKQDSFKIFFEWIVQCILNPEFPRDDGLYRMARRNLQTRTDTIGSSVLQSSKWTGEFSRAMKARPVFNDGECEAVDGCEACNISNRTSTFFVKFSGPRYDKKTLENITESDSDDSQDSNGNPIPEDNKKFYVGRTCHARAQLAHSFWHWEKQLREQIENELQGAGYIDEDNQLLPQWWDKVEEMDPGARLKWTVSVANDLRDACNDLYKDYNKGLKNAETNMNQQRTGKWRYT